MSNVALVSFKLQPDEYAVVRALAISQGKSLSEFVRETLKRALELDLQVQALASFFAQVAQEAEA